MSPPTTARAADPDVLNHFMSRRGSFGALNLLPNHLPPESKVRTLVKNAMTVDYGIGRAYQIPQYLASLRGFAATSVLNYTKLGLESEYRQLYREHADYLATLTGDQLTQAVLNAIPNSLSAINIFSPRQCNLQCRSCYTSAVSVEKTPFSQAEVEAYVAGFKRITIQAKRLGATTIYTSGDGEPTIFPRFFDLLEFVQQQGLQWLFFTAGLSFSSEANARSTWHTSYGYLSNTVRQRMAERIHRHEKAGHMKPTVAAFLEELSQYRDNIQIYHSLWSTDSKTNTLWRHPIRDHYDYVEVETRGMRFHLPSSVCDLMTAVFHDEYRERFGLELPVSHISLGSVIPLATFVVDKGIKSYFESTVVTGRNLTMNLQAVSPNELEGLLPFMARTNCSFRNIHQPTVKVKAVETGSLFYVTPGMGIGFRDLEAAGILSSYILPDERDLFSVLHGPLMVYANYGYVLGCKCDLFAQQAHHDGGRLYEQWRNINALQPANEVSVDGIVSRLCEQSDVRDQ